MALYDLPIYQDALALAVNMEQVEAVFCAIRSATWASLVAN